MYQRSSHCSLPAQVCCKKKASRKKRVYDFAQSNFDSISSYLEQFYRTFSQSHKNHSAPQNWLLFRDILRALQEKHVPKKCLFEGTDRPWFSKHIKRCLNKKKRLYAEARCSKRDEDWSAYLDCAKICKKLIEEVKKIIFNLDLSNFMKTNPKKFWKVIFPSLLKEMPQIVSKSGSNFGFLFL